MTTTTFTDCRTATSRYAILDAYNTVYSEDLAGALEAVRTWLPEDWSPPLPAAPQSVEEINEAVADYYTGEDAPEVCELDD